MTTIYNVSTLNATTIEAGTIWATNIRYIGDTNGSYSLNTLGAYVYNELNDAKFMSTITTYMNTRPYPNDTYSVKRIMPILPQSPDTPVNASDLTTKVYVDEKVIDLKTVTNTSVSTLSTSFNNLSTRVTTELTQTNLNVNNVSSRLTTGLATLTSRITTDVNGLTLTTGDLQTYGVNVSNRLASEVTRLSLQSLNDMAGLNSRITTEVSTLSSRISTLTYDTNTSILNVSSRVTTTIASIAQTATVIENVSVRLTSLLNVSADLTSVSSRLATMNATLMNITGAADVSNFTNQLTTLTDKVTLNTSNISDLRSRFNAFTEVVNTSFASTVSQASASLVTTLNVSLSLVNASFANVVSVQSVVNTSLASLANRLTELNTSFTTLNTPNATVNASFTTLTTSVSQLNASVTLTNSIVNASFASLATGSSNATVNASFTTLTTSVSQLNASVALTNSIVNASFASLATGSSNATVNASFTTLTTSVSQLNASVMLTNSTVNASFTSVESSFSIVNASVKYIARSYLVIEGESTPTGQILWSCGSSSPMVGKFGLYLPTSGIIHSIVGLTNTEIGSINSLEVTLSSCTLTDNTAPLRLIQFSKINGMLVAKNYDSIPLAREDNIILLVDAVGKDLNNTVIPIPANIRFRMTMEFEKTQYSSLTPKYVFNTFEDIGQFIYFPNPYILSASDLQVTLIVTSVQGNPRFEAVSYLNKTYSNDSFLLLGGYKPLTVGTMNFTVPGSTSRFISLQLSLPSKSTDAFTLSSFKINGREQLDVIPFVKKYF